MPCDLTHTVTAKSGHGVTLTLTELRSCIQVRVALAVEAS